MVLSWVQGRASALISPGIPVEKHRLGAPPFWATDFNVTYPAFSDVGGCPRLQHTGRFASLDTSDWIGLILGDGACDHLPGITGPVQRTEDVRMVSMRIVKKLNQDQATAAAAVVSATSADVYLLLVISVLLVQQLLRFTHVYPRMTSRKRRFLKTFGMDRSSTSLSFMRYAFALLAIILRQTFPGGRLSMTVKWLLSTFAMRVFLMTQFAQDMYESRVIVKDRLAVIDTLQDLADSLTHTLVVERATNLAALFKRASDGSSANTVWDRSVQTRRR